MVLLSIPVWRLSDFGVKDLSHMKDSSVVSSRKASPLFSVLIPVYNRADTVQPALKSVKAQTYDNFECLVIDDGSADGDDLAATVASLEDSRFVYMRQENKGAGSARNHGIDVARGSYIALLDSDDSFLPEKLAKIARIVDRSDGNIFIYSQMIVDRGIGKVWIRPQQGVRPGERVDEYLLCRRGWILTSTIVVPTATARTVRFDENLPSSQDADFAIRVANTGASFRFVQEPLVVIDDRPNIFRVSKNTNYRPLLEWIDRIRGQEISERSYWAYRGSHYARAVAYSNRLYGIVLFLQSFVHCAYPLSQAPVVFAQIAIPQGFYQVIASYVVRLRGQLRDNKL